MAFGQTLFIFAQNHWQMRIGRERGIQRFEYVYLSWRVVDMIVTTNNMRDVHIEIIDHDSQIIGWCTIGAHDNQVIKFRIGNFNTAFDHIFNHDTAIKRVAKTYHGFHTGRWRIIPIPPITVVTRFLFALHRLVTHLLQLLW